MLGPYTLLRLVIAFAGAMIIFGELPDLFSCFGAALIIASCLLASEVIGRNQITRIRRTLVESIHHNLRAAPYWLGNSRNKAVP